MLKFHIIIIKISIFTNKNSQSDTFFPKLKNTIVKIDIKSFSVYFSFDLLTIIPLEQRVIRFTENLKVTYSHDKTLYYYLYRSFKL